MPWLEVSVRCARNRQPAIEAALADLGAQAVTLLDADVDAPDERAVLEPGVGETPLWDTLVVQGLFDAKADRRGLLLAIDELLPGLADDAVQCREVADQDWERVWLDQYRPMRFGERLWIYPWTIEPAPDAGVVVRLDPGLAFGTGTHPTTALCLEWLDGLPLQGRRVLDVGCGSGVLAIAALKLGAASAVGIDNDPQALHASRDNAQRNGVGDSLALYPPEQVPTLRFGVVVANILANALDALAPRIAEQTEAGGVLALSGILAGQETALLARYAEWFDDLRTTVRDGWVRIDGTRR